MAVSVIAAKQPESKMKSSAAYAAADAAKSKAIVKVLSICADIGLQALIKLKSPGCAFLDLTD